MTLFHFPKVKHNRTQKPKQYKRYQSYKRFLQAEFSRVCIYCRQPDSSAPNLNFGVDHYKPKSIPKYASLNLDYTNLYYCCGQCNSRKNNYWPTNEKKGPYIVNPCDQVMSQHIKLNTNSKKFDYVSNDGQFTIELLQLNEEATVKFRRTTVHLIERSKIDSKDLQDQIDTTEKLFASGKMTAKEHTEILKILKENLELTNNIIEMHSGSLPLPIFEKSRSTS